MAYQPIRTSDDLARLVPGVTREDHWLDFKGLNATTGWPSSRTPTDATNFGLTLRRSRMKTVEPS
jgi:hypothetical protein